MNTAQKLLILLSEKNYAAYVQQQLNPTLWLRLRETAGSTAVNSGSGGSALDAANTAATVGQTGQLGANEAYDFDGATSLLTVTNNALLANMTTQKWALLAKADSLGEGSISASFAWGGGGGTDHYMRFGTTNALRTVIRGSTGPVSAVSNDNQISDCLGNFAWYFMDYDDANTLGNGRVARMFKGINGVVTQLTLAQNVALVGSVVNQTNDLIIGNNSLAQWTYDGLMDEVIVKSGSLWTTSEMQTLVNLAGV